MQTNADGSSPGSASFCGRCGKPVGPGTEGDHAGCRAALALEPPRYCARCARRMVVQVTPGGWAARCVEHGTLVST